MTPERADELLIQLLDGALPEDGHRDLLEAALNDPALGRRLAELLKLQPFLMDALGGDEGDEAFHRRIQHALSDQSDTNFIRSVVQRAAKSANSSSRRRPTRRRLS